MQIEPQTVSGIKGKRGREFCFSEFSQPRGSQDRAEGCQSGIAHDLHLAARRVLVGIGRLNESAAGCILEIQPAITHLRDYSNDPDFFIDAMITSEQRSNGLRTDIGSG